MRVHPGVLADPGMRGWQFSRMPRCRRNTSAFSFTERGVSSRTPKNSRMGIQAVRSLSDTPSEQAVGAVGPRAPTSWATGTVTVLSQLMARLRAVWGGQGGWMAGTGGPKRHIRKTLFLALVIPLSVLVPGAVAVAQSPYGVSLVPSAIPAFVPPACGTGTPAYNYAGSGDAADPQVVDSGGTYYAFTTGNALGNHIAALVSSSPNRGYRPYTGSLLGLVGPAEPFALGAAQHADLSRRLLVRRALGHVLRRRAGRPCLRQRLRLPGRGHGTAPSLRPTCSSPTWPTAPNSWRASRGLDRPPALRRPRHGHCLPDLEAERRRVVCAGLHLGPAARTRRAPDSLRAPRPCPS